MTDDDRNVDPAGEGKERRQFLYRIGQTAGQSFRKGGPGREAAKRVGGAVIRRGLWRFLR